MTVKKHPSTHELLFTSEKTSQKHPLLMSRKASLSFAPLLMSGGQHDGLSLGKTPSKASLYS